SGPRPYPHTDRLAVIVLAVSDIPKVLISTTHWLLELKSMGAAMMNHRRSVQTSILFLLQDRTEYTLTLGVQPVRGIPIRRTWLIRSVLVEELQMAFSSSQT